MIQLINKLKKNQKGFTLVELIVVLVILAILAAFTIPAMLGFVNDARGKAAIAEAREIYVAAQSAGSDMAAKTPTGLLTVSTSSAGGTTNADSIRTQVLALLNNDIPNIGTGTNLTGEISATGTSTMTDLVKGDKNKANVTMATDGKVRKVEYNDSTGNYKITIEVDASGTSSAISTKYD